ncbi:hypothetical protein [Streptomyces sp. NPDC048106]|uniref:hypothetical protein n=1 Tax=Streptomyces sp. NPDC048106 TaxID=3155750 RepID=UPI0034537197
MNAIKVGTVVRPRTMVVAAAATILSLSVSACSHHTATDPTATTAAQACDSTLDASGVAALQRLLGTDTGKFVETTGDGLSDKFSLREAAKNVRNNTQAKGRNYCIIGKYKKGGKRTISEISFDAVQRSKVAHLFSDGVRVRYPMGIRAETMTDGPSDDVAYTTYIDFTCPLRTTGKKSSLTQYVEAVLSVTRTGEHAGGEARDTMLVLNPVARAMAKELGCLSQANLPLHVPSPTPRKS